MDRKRKILSSCLCLLLVVGLFAEAPTTSQAQEDVAQWNNRIRREKFDTILPQVMRENDVDMWIHVMREAIPDGFGAEEFGSTSGTFVFTDRGEDRIERAIIGRRWGATQRQRGEQSNLIEESGAFDIITDAVFVREPVTGPETEYDHRFEGLRAFVEERDPKRIAVNFKQDLAQWPTFRGERDGISHTDFVLLTKALGDKYADRIVTSERVMLSYINRKPQSEVELLKKMRQVDVDRAIEAFDAVEVGVTRTRGEGFTVFRRTSRGLSQRGRSDGWEGAVVEGGDILAAPSVGMFAYVLREGETEPPPEIQKLWAEYLKIDEILAKNIRAGLTPQEIIENYTRDFDEAGIVLKAEQLHMAIPKNDFPVYAEGLDPEKTLLSVDAHGHMKGARAESVPTYFTPRVGSYGPDWSKEIPLAENHHFVIEYFFYLPSPASDGEDQYLLWWDHEEAVATADGIEYLTPPQKELILVN